jgi:sarcosine oxidase
MPRWWDCIVLGTGGVGSAALFELARRGLRALGIDRFGPAHDRGSSHGETRIIRLAYFEHPDYVPLLRRAYERWEELEKLSGQKLFFPCGLLQCGPERGEVLPGVRRAAAVHNLEIDELDAASVARRFPGFRLLPGLAGVFERRAGFLRVEHCVEAHLDLAVRHGAELRPGDAAKSWELLPSGAVRLRTERGEQHEGERLIVAAGAWSGPILSELGLPLEVLRKPLLWFDAGRDSSLALERGAPAFLFELPSGVFYGFPALGGRLKAAEHSGGDSVADPLVVDRSLRERDRDAVARFLAACLPALGEAPRCVDHKVCLYTVTPDRHFIVDRLPAAPQVAFAAGLSGHGFKFAGVLGEILVDLALNGRSPWPLEFLGLARPALRQRTIEKSERPALH